VAADVYREIDPRVAIKALDDLSRSVGWQIISAWVSDERASKMKAIIGAGVPAQQRDELAGAIRQLNMVLDAPIHLHGRFADQLPIEGETDG